METTLTIPPSKGHLYRGLGFYWCGLYKDAIVDSGPCQDCMKARNEAIQEGWRVLINGR